MSSSKFSKLSAKSKRIIRQNYEMGPGGAGMTKLFEVGFSSFASFVFVLFYFILNILILSTVDIVKMQISPWECVSVDFNVPPPTHIQKQEK